MKIRFAKYTWWGWRITRYWSGKLVYIQCGYWAAILDFRKDVISDMTGGRMSQKDLPPKEQQ